MSTAIFPSITTDLISLAQDYENTVNQQLEERDQQLEERGQQLEERDQQLEERGQQLDERS